MNPADDFLRSFFKAYPQANGGQLNLEDLNKLMTEFQQKMNDRPIDDFDGLSPAQMNVLLYEPLSDSSSIHMNKPDDLYLEQVPLFQLSELLLTTIKEAGMLKLTQKGNLPVAVCKLLFSKQLIEWKYMEHVTRIREEEIPYIWPLKQYLLDQGIVKMKGNALSLTKQGEKFLEKNKTVRLVQLFLFFGNRFHWGNFYDIRDNGKCGQLGWAFSLLLLQKYGDVPRESEFYSGKLIHAFEKQLYAGTNSIKQQESIAAFHRAYAIRFFDCFANWFGLVNIQRKNVGFIDHLIVAKSPLFDLLFKRMFAARHS